MGLAVTDPLGAAILPVPFLTYKSIPDLLFKLKSVAVEKDAGMIVLGLPKSPDGSLGRKAKECENLAKKIKKGLGLPVHLEDESFTSREAEEILIRDMNLSRKKRKKVKDSLSACLILKSYLSSVVPGSERKRGAWHTSS